MITAKYHSDDWFIQRDRVIKSWLNNDQDAFDLLMDLNQASELWDDLIDRDKEVTDENIHAAFTDLILRVPNNPFYIKHRATLHPILVSAIISWRTANELEKGTRSERAVAYTLRSVDLQILSVMIYLIRGQDAAIKITPEIWRTFVSRADSIEDYLLKGETLCR